MKEDKITVLYKKVNEIPRILKIKNSLKEKQKLVGGLIEVVPYLDNMLIICNEEGKIYNLKANIRFGNDYIAGDLIVVGDDYENADFKSLTANEINKAKDDIKRRSVHYKKVNNVLENELDED